MDINTVRFVFFGFLLIFTILLIAALRIALHKIKDGPKIEETDTTEKDHTIAESADLIASTDATPLSSPVALKPTPRITDVNGKTVEKTSRSSPKNKTTKTSARKNTESSPKKTGSTPKKTTKKPTDSQDKA